MDKANAQTSVVQDRCILDNMFMAFEAMEWVKDND